MLNTSPRPAAISGKPRDIWLHDAEPTEALAARIEKAAAGLEIREGFPDSILELNDVYVVPGESTACLYDREGRRIEESCVRRGEALEDRVGAKKERIDLPTDYAFVETPVLYLSMYFRHWGHFLTESASRLWPRHVHPEFRDMEVFFSGFNLGFRRSAVAQAFLAGFSSPPRFAPLRAAARVAKCFVPAPSFVNRAAAYAGHLAAMRDLAATMSRDTRPAPTDQPVYLSRSRLSDVERVVVNESAFEEILRRGGVRIVHPQEMPLPDQVALFNTHATILGCAGSALHNLMFAAEGRKIRTHVFSERHLNRNCLLIDGVVENTGHYVSVLNSAKSLDLATPRGSLAVNLESAVEYLRGAGIL